MNDPWTARWLDAVRKVRIRDIPDKISRALLEFYWRNSTAVRETDHVAVALEPVLLWAGGDPAINPRGHRKDLALFKKRLLRARSIMNALQPRITSRNWDCCGLDELGEKDFVYFDPPYMDATIGYYRDKMDHRNLVRHLLEAPYLWMISGYTSPLYLRYLGPPEATKQIRRSVCITSRVDRAGSLSTECLWTNYSILDDGSVVRKRMRRRRILKKKCRN